MKHILIFQKIILNDNNYKDQLLRYLQHNYKVYPKYVTKKNEEDNLFYCDIFRNENDKDIFISSGSGISKKIRTRCFSKFSNLL